MPLFTRRLLLASLMLGARRIQASSQPEPPGLGGAWPAQRPTPALKLSRLDDEPWDLNAQRGHVVLLNFWASWCQPCRAELPSLELLAHWYAPQALHVVTINYRESDATLRRFLEEMPISLPILRDTDGRTTRAWGLKMFPSTVAIGRDGRATHLCFGEVDWTSAAARTWIEHLLNADARSASQTPPPAKP
jgi:thiol-disulfide isomerase/thioredoxin